MSRSYKKTPGYCDRNPFMKRYANHVVRHFPIDQDLPSGGHYRRITDPWNISDWRFLAHGGRRELEREAHEYAMWIRNSWGEKYERYESYDELIAEYKRRYPIYKSYMK